MAGLDDIATRADCERLVREFYSRAFDDEIIGWLFTDVAHLDLEAHVPQITSFWETILLGERTYFGSPFPPHADLHAKVQLRSGHFGRWLALWQGTVDDLFEGETANLAKAHAMRVAQAFYTRLQSFPSPADEHQPVETSSPTLPITQHGPVSGS